MIGTISIAGRAITRGKRQISDRITFRSKLLLTGVRSFSSTQCSKMKIVQFCYKNKPDEIRAGYVTDDNKNVVDINKTESSIPSTVLSILKNGQLEQVKILASNCKSPASVPLSDVSLKAPVTGMDKVLCIGLNYKDHCEEQKLTPPPVPMVFSKFASCVVGASDAVKLRTDTTQKVDWEVELAVVIGKPASRVSAADAYKYVAGYTVAQDISARDWQKERNAGQFLLGKAMDTFCPIGPWLATADEVGDPETLNIKCSLNGVDKQSSNTKQLVHKIPNIIERISSVMTLLPGDIILTGTPGGVGMYRNPPEYLKPGDTISSEIEKIGVLITKVDKM